VIAPFSTMTSWPSTQAAWMLRTVSPAFAIPCLQASSKLSLEVAVSSMILATDTEPSSSVWNAIIADVGAVIEIRTYKLRAGAGAEFHRLVVEESLPMLQRWGVEVVASGPSLDDEDSYFLIRAYPSLEELQRSQDAFYGSDEWRDGPREAIVSRIEDSQSVVLPAAALSRR